MVDVSLRNLFYCATCYSAILIVWMITIMQHNLNEDHSFPDDDESSIISFYMIIDNTNNDHDDNDDGSAHQFRQHVIGFWHNDNQYSNDSDDDGHESVALHCMLPRDESSEDGDDWSRPSP